MDHQFSPQHSVDPVSKKAWWLAVASSIWHQGSPGFSPFVIQNWRYHEIFSFFKPPQGFASDMTTVTFNNLIFSFHLFFHIIHCFWPPLINEWPNDRNTAHRWRSALHTVAPLLCHSWLSQNTLQLCPEKGLLVYLLGPLQVCLGAQHLLKLAVFAWQGAGINGLLHHEYDITKRLTHRSLLSKVELIVAPLAVDEVAGEDKYYLKMKHKRKTWITRF